MFSPYYAWSRRRGGADPENHCAVNVALYGRRRRWAMTERGRSAMFRDAETFAVGPSSLTWDGASLTVAIDEWTAPRPSRVRGIVRVFPTAMVADGFALDGRGSHVWRPIAPTARVEVSLTHPALSWKGDGYLDTNAGAEPLEAAFKEWNWSRAATKDGCAIVYDVTRRDGGAESLGLRVRRDGTVIERAAPNGRPLPRAPVWRMPRTGWCDGDDAASVVRTLEDAPFYARSLLSTKLDGERVTAIHESLSLDKFRQPIVQAMLPFRMPRKTW